VVVIGSDPSDVAVPVADPLRSDGVAEACMVAVAAPHALAPAKVVVAAMSVTPASFAEALLDRLHLPVTDNNVRALVAFQYQEGGHENGASFNPLNTMLRTKGSVNFKTKKPEPGVQAYGSWDEGLEATAKTMAQGNMRPIFDSLRASVAPSDTIAAIARSDWGWWDPKKGRSVLLPHAAADAIVRSEASFRSYSARAYSGAGFLFGGGRALKYGAMGVVGVLALGGLVLVGYGIKKKVEERKARRWVQSS
jgi:hypothetical protein